jgi:vacuolar-type H+-ATPase subunit H
VRADDHSARPRPLAPNAGEHIRAVVEAAERATESIIDDAEAQARSLLAEARADAERGASERLAAISGQIDALLEQAEAIRDGAERLAVSLQRARSPLGPEKPSDGPAPVSHLKAVDSDEQRGDDSGARLLATQMAVSGSSREEIENRLRTRFEIEDTAAILDAILGPED